MPPTKDNSEKKVWMRDMQAYVKGAIKDAMDAKNWADKWKGQIKLGNDPRHRWDLVTLGYLQANYTATSASGTYGGLVFGDGTSGPLPAGWTSSRSSTGNYIVTHNLNLTSFNYIVVASNAGSTTGKPNLITRGADFFQIIQVDSSTSTGITIDSAFTFILLVTP